jgi:quercetin dioxygenase-like cupin family protein
MKETKDNPFKKELFRTSKSWDGAELPDYPVGKPELVAMRYVFAPGQSLGWHHHDVMNFGVVEQGELTIVSADGREKTVCQGDAVVEMVGTVHHGENRGRIPVVLDMFYLLKEGQALSENDDWR